MLFIQTQFESAGPANMMDFRQDVGTPTSFNSFPFMIECTIHPDKISMRMKYNSSVLLEREGGEAGRLVRPPNSAARLRATDGQEDQRAQPRRPEARAEIAAKNPFPPASSLVCLHRLIENQMALRPDSEAVVSTEFSLTYAEVDRYSAALAAQLIALGVGPEVLVPMCYEKSPWAIVTQLRILRAGGGMVPLDPAHPPPRRLDIIMRVT